MKVCAVTCTGARPELLNLCRKWIGNQTVKVDEWLVSYDVEERPAVDAGIIQKVSAVPEGWAALKHIAKQNWNLYNALKAVPDDYAAVVFEDDDYYRANHVEKCLENLENTPLSCQRTLHVWDLPSRRFKQDIKLWPSEGCVAMRPDNIGYYADLLPRPRNWDYHRELPLHMSREETVVQIKGAGRGLPGRQGTTEMQVSGFKGGGCPDPDLEKLDYHLEGHAEDYLKLLL